MGRSDCRSPGRPTTRTDTLSGVISEPLGRDVSELRAVAFFLHHRYDGQTRPTARRRSYIPRVSFACFRARLRQNYTTDRSFQLRASEYHCALEPPARPIFRPPRNIHHSDFERSRWFHLIAQVHGRLMKIDRVTTVIREIITTNESAGLYPLRTRCASNPGTS